MLIGGAAVAAVAVVGGAAWAAMSFFSTGEQPAAALPADTLAYAGIDLDPSGGQKIEALRMLNKFPAFKDELGLDTDDDLRKALFDEIQGGDDACANLELRARHRVLARQPRRRRPWSTPSRPSIFVVQVSDADAAAEPGWRSCKNCVANGDASEAAPPDADARVRHRGRLGRARRDDEIAERVAADGAASPLADDADFQTWTEPAGDPGILTVYAAAEARRRDLRLGRRPAAHGRARPQSMEVEGWRGHRPA